MKSATILLVAVAVSTTLFLECSTTPFPECPTAAADSKSCKETVTIVEPVKKFLIEALKHSQRTKLRCIKITDDASPKAKGDVKERLNRAGIWSKGLLAFCTQFELDLNDAFNSGCVKEIKKCSDKLSEKIVVTEPEYIQWIEDLKVAPKDVREGFEREMKTSLDNAVIIDIVLKAVMAGVYNKPAEDSTTCKDTVTFDDSVIKYLDESLEHSKRAKLRCIKVIDDAIPTAEGVVKETLNGAGDWAEGVLAWCMQFKQNMDDALRSGCIKRIAKCSDDLFQALAVKVPEFEQWIEALKCAPECVQEGFKKEMQTNIDNDVIINEELKRLVACV
ncbi:uncharacterized protein [Maniola hyperantus]|uniref:uncharacterized protein n=1 Tax=Aphantopus hyperantus TaxID=2795564 RepID=UPI003748A334